MELKSNGCPKYSIFVLEEVGGRKGLHPLINRSKRYIFSSVQLEQAKLECVSHMAKYSSLEGKITIPIRFFLFSERETTVRI